MMNRITLSIAATLLIILSGCRQRQTQEPLAEDTNVAWLRKTFPNSRIITTQEQLDSLLTIAENQVAKNPTPEAYFERLSLYAAGEQWEKALQDAEKALTLLPPGDTSELAMKFHFAKANYTGKIGRSAESEAEYRWIAEHGNTEAAREAQVSLGILPEVLEEVEIEKRASPKESQARWQESYDRAKQMQEKGLSDEAKALFRKMISQDVRDVSSMVGLAWVERETGNYDEAIAWLQKAQAIAPDYTAVYDQLFLVYEQTGDADKQIDALLSLIEWKWRISRWERNDQILEVFAKDPDYAISCLQERLSFEDGLKEDWEILLGQLYEYLGREDEEALEAVASLPRVVTGSQSGQQTGTGVLSQEALNVCHFRYNQPINGYTVTIDWQSGTEEAEFHFVKGNTSFSVRSYSFDPHMFGMPADEKEFTLRYRPKPKGEMLYSKEPFFFSDVDFDGTNELLVQEPLAGTRGTNLYHVYELDGTERTDEPLDAICDMTTFNTSEKSITQEEYFGVILGSNYLKYRRQRDGSFVLTDSTHVDFKVDFTDSVRVHYRKQGDKMVLVKKEIL